MYKLFAFLLSLIFLASFHVSAQKIDVLTYNIRYASFDKGPSNWDTRKEGVFAILKSHDFVGLQEVLPVQMDDINKKLGNEYGYLFRTREADPAKGEGSPILYNKSKWKVSSSGFLWLSDTPETPGSNTWGAAFNRILSYGIFSSVISGDSILVINTHFDHISQSAREKSIDLILNRFKENFYKMPVIFMGDLNVTPDNQVYIRIITNSILKDSYKKIHPNESIAGASFHGWKSEVKPVDRIDYVFISPFLEVKKSEVLRNKFNANYPSDHFPVNSLLIFKK